MTEIQQNLWFYIIYKHKEQDVMHIPIFFLIFEK